MTWIFLGIRSIIGADEGLMEFLAGSDTDIADLSVRGDGCSEVGDPDWIGHCQGPWANGGLAKAPACFSMTKRQIPNGLKSHGITRVPALGFDKEYNRLAPRICPKAPGSKDHRRNP